MVSYSLSPSKKDKSYCALIGGCTAVVLLLDTVRSPPREGAYGAGVVWLVVWTDDTVGDGCGLRALATCHPSIAQVTQLKDVVVGVKVVGL